MMLRMYAICLTFCLAIAPASDVRAEPPAEDARIYLVVPVVGPGEEHERVYQVARDVEGSLSSDARKIPMATAAGAFRDTHSREPSSAPEAETAHLREESKRIAELVATKRVQEAVTRATALRERIAAVTDDLNRDDGVARELLRVCVSHVRALVMSNNLEQAKRIARECRELVPDLQPSRAETPPPVMDVFEEVEREQKLSETGMLFVESEPGGCAVYVQGRRLGETPFSMSGPVGQAYRVRVECEGASAGRVHTVTVRPEPTHLFVDASFEQAVSTSDDMLRLTYAAVSDAALHAHAQRLAKALRATDIVLVSLAGEQVRLRRVAARGGAAILVEPPYTAMKLKHALAELNTEHASREVKPSPERVVDVGPPPERAGRPRKRWLWATGGALAAVGVTSFALAGWQVKENRDAGERALDAAADRMAYARRAGPWMDTPAMLLSIAGGVMAGAGFGMLASRTPDGLHRWLAPIVGALGAGLLAGGIVQLSDGESCSRDARPQLQACIEKRASVARGMTLSMAALPLLSASSVMIVQPWNERVSVAAAPSSVHVTYRF